jgi:hypothetical protein
MVSIAVCDPGYCAGAVTPENDASRRRVESEEVAQVRDAKGIARS